MIALVRDHGSDEWAAGVAVGLADMVGRRRRRTFLANAAGGADALDRLMDAHGGPGLTSALTGAASVASIARTSPHQKFAYLPAGDGALPYSGLRRMQAFRRFLTRVCDGGGTLLLYLGEEDLGQVASGSERRPSEDLRLDGCIALGEARGAAAELGAPLLARVERPAPPPAAPPPETAAPPEEAAARVSAGAGSLVRLLLPLAAVVLVWLGWKALVPGPGDAGGPPPGVAGEVAGPSDVEVADADSASAAVDDGGTTEVPDFHAPEARYSVLVGSYIRLGDAMKRRAELAEEGGLFYVTPTPVRGRVYYRVLEGAYEDRADAATAMASLVTDGRKDTYKDWDVRPVRLAFDLGTFASRADADRQADEALADDVPAYVLRDTAAAPLYRVYAGAFTSADEAEPLADRLEALGSGAELISRTGVAP
ncbi:MAG: SPOR domain-containing protein [Gemmatimonadales bacterium]